MTGFLYQFLGHAGEAVAGANACLDVGLSLGYIGIDRVSQLLTGGIPGDARLGQHHFGIAGGSAQVAGRSIRFAPMFTTSTAKPIATATRPMRR